MIEMSLYCTEFVWTLSMLALGDIQRWISFCAGSLLVSILVELMVFSLPAERREIIGIYTGMVVNNVSRVTKQDLEVTLTAIKYACNM